MYTEVFRQVDLSVPGFCYRFPPPPSPLHLLSPPWRPFAAYCFGNTLLSFSGFKCTVLFFFSRNRSCDLIVCKPTDKSNIYRQLLILTYTSLFTLVPDIFLDIFLDSLSLLRGSLALSVAKRNIKNNIWDHATTTFRLILRSFRIFNQKWIR